MEPIYTAFNPEAFQNKRTAIIDGDGFAWAIGWLNKDAMTDKQVTDAVDSCVHDILIGVQAEHYIGILAPKLDEGFRVIGEPGPIPNFRKAIAVTLPYKGNRSEKPDWYLKWAPIIETHLKNVWGFICTPAGLEADDFVATLVTELTAAGIVVVCCGNDKDLYQIPGNHFNVKTKVFRQFDSHQSSYQLWLQVLTGDDTDNIRGLSGLGTGKPGLGPKGAEKILDAVDINSGEKFRTAVLAAYVDKFGEDAGIQRFYETYMLVKLRTDVPTDDFDIQEICRGYSLQQWNDTRLPTAIEPDEVIPTFDFS